MSALGLALVIAGVLVIYWAIGGKGISLPSGASTPPPNNPPTGNGNTA